jgi:hypothetical protein
VGKGVWFLVPGKGGSGLSNSDGDGPPLGGQVIASETSPGTDGSGLHTRHGLSDDAFHADGGDIPFPD